MVDASKAAASGKGDLMELANDITSTVNLISALCDYVSYEVLEAAERLASCVESQDLACAINVISALRESLKRLSKANEVLTTLSIQRVFTGVGLLATSMFILLTPTSFLDLEVAPLSVGLAIAALLLYTNIWSSVAEMAGAAILIPVTVLNGQLLFSWISVILLVSGAASLAIWSLLRPAPGVVMKAQG
ncbi:MAG: hypothetical protein ACP5FT_00005 [Acidilobus sp.]